MGDADDVKGAGAGDHYEFDERGQMRCFVCGRWCVTDGDGFTCSKRGGCGAEWTGE